MAWSFSAFACAGANQARIAMALGPTCQSPFYASESWPGTATCANPE